MKKSIIAAGAASVALAAMPIVGVFADDVRTQEDTLEITINSVCSFGHTDATASPAISVTGVAHANGDGTWGSEETADTLSKTMSPGTTTGEGALGTTTLGVYCNNTAGYVITTSGAGSLTNATNDEIPINPSFSGSSSGWSYKVAIATAGAPRGEVKNGHTAWTAATGANNPIANQVIAGSASSTPTTTNAGDYYTVTYGVGVADNQAASVYEGSITYTLGQPE